MTLRILAVLAAAASLTAVVAAIAHGAGPASPGQGRGPETYTIGLFGDMPYNALGLAVPEPARRHQQQQRRVLDLRR